MRNKSKVKKGECVYCGQYDLLTRDHIPPKNIYSTPRPNNLISVPCCLLCNSKESKDDEYFRNALTMRYDTYEHPDATKNWEVVKRSFKRAEGMGLKESILGTMKEIDLFTPSGIFLGKSGMYQIEVNRLLNTVNRIIKGIFYSEFGNRLPDDYSVRSFLLESIKINTEILNLISLVKAGISKTIGNNVFTYWIHKTKEDPNTTLSLLLFYEKVAFIGFTVNNE